MHLRKSARRLFVAAFVLPGISLLLAGAHPAAAQYVLKSRRDFRTGDHPVQIIAADFDGDGLLDLISVDEFGNYIGLEKGFGDGTFREINTVVAGSGPTGAVFVDVTGDGKPDIVASNFQSSDVTVNPGTGAGHFGAKIRSLVGAVPYGLAVGDWNGDGFLDVVTLNSTAGTLTTLRGHNTGSFDTPATITVGTNPSGIAVADFNSDGKVDLAVANAGSDNVQIWRNGGTGTFTLNTTLSTGAGTVPVFVAAADLNSDNHPDLVVGLQATGQLKVYLANTTGGFQNPSTLTPGAGPRSVAIDDINKDGKLDLMVGMSGLSGVGQMALLTGTGTGSFSAPTVVSTGPTPSSVVTGDFNVDGNLDVVTASLTGNAVSLLETTAAGAFIVADKVQLGSGSFPANVVVADFNRDGKPDVATADEASDDVSIATGNGLGAFSAPTVIGTGLNSGPVVLAPIDTNHDNAPDLVVLTSSNTMSVLQNNGTGAMTATNGLSIGACNDPSAVAVGEINGDQNPDIAFTCDISYHVCTRRGTGGTGASAFGPVVCTLVDPVPEGVAIANYDFDSLQDIAFSSETSNWVAIGFSNGSGAFWDIPSSFPTGTGPWGVAKGDLNGDGYMDIVVANSTAGTVSALLGDGGGGFSFPSIDSPAGEGPVAVALADLNADGKLDAAVVNSNGNNVSFLLGDGFGNFVKAGDFGTRDLPLSVAIGDFNLDGKPDLAVADNYSDTISILVNQSALGDPLQTCTIIDQAATVYRWGIVPGAVYDVIRGQVHSVVVGSGTVNLGPVTCLANDLPDTDTAALADTALPPVGDAFFYLVRPVIGGVAGQYSVSSTGKPGVPSSGGCF